MIEECKNAKLYSSVPTNEIKAEHPRYGEYCFGKWYDVYGHLYFKNTKEHFIHKFAEYEICIINDAITSCIIRNKKRQHKWLKVSNDDQDPMISLSYDKKSYKFMLSHVILASVFSHNNINETVDHINDDSKDNHIDNLQWLSYSDNAKKGRQKQLDNGIVQKHNIESVVNYPNEVWRRVNSFTEVSNYARIKRRDKDIVYGHVVRGKKYRQATVKFEIDGLPHVSRKYYVHQIVWTAFNGVVPEDKIILHDDTVPLVDGTYRNWLCDLRLGTRTENNIEHNEQKRVALTS
jgi:hypothetical protein